MHHRIAEILTHFEKRLEGEVLEDPYWHELKDLLDGPANLRGNVPETPCTHPNAKCIGECSEGCCDRYECPDCGLRSERDRYREALERIADADENNGFARIKIARQALGLSEFP